METIKFKFVGKSPLLMHSVRGANPLDPDVQKLKALASGRKKTDEVHRAIARMEWELAMYYDADLGPFVPTSALRAAIVEGAKLAKLGMAVKRATIILSEKEPLEFKGPRTPDKLWEGGHVDTRAVVVSNARVMRTRPVFPAWSVSFEMMFDPTMLQRQQLIEAAETAGRLIGLLEYRPSKGGSFGRFDVEAMKA